MIIILYRVIQKDFTDNVTCVLKPKGNKGNKIWKAAMLTTIPPPPGNNIWEKSHLGGVNSKHRDPEI
jgi:hypothetical protein